MQSMIGNGRIQWKSLIFSFDFINIEFDQINQINHKNQHQIQWN